MLQARHGQTGLHRRDTVRRDTTQHPKTWVAHPPVGFVTSTLKELMFNVFSNLAPRSVSNLKGCEQTVDKPTCATGCWQLLARWQMEALQSTVLQTLAFFTDP